MVPFPENGYSRRYTHYGIGKAADSAITRHRSGKLHSTADKHGCRRGLVRAGWYTYSELNGRSK